MKVLFLSAWYPYRYDKMAGLFVQKHAEAVALYCDVKLIYVHADEKINDFETIISNSKNLTEITVYYPINKKSFFYKLFKIINYIRAYLIGFKLLKKENFKPDIVHANVLTRTGVIAYIIKLFTGIPYVITEHWSRYFSQNDNYKGFIRKKITEHVIRNASAVLPVSTVLKNAMINQNLKNDNYQIINNVVDETFFISRQNSERKKIRLLHVSCFDEKAKNIKGILRAYNKVCKTDFNVELYIIGNGSDYDEVFAYYMSLNFEKDKVYFLNEKPREEIARWMNESDFFVLFSNYETAGVVIAESLVCGLPVLSTNVGIAPDYIKSENGIVINAGDENALYDAIVFMINNLKNFNNTEIQEKAQQLFSYKHIGGLVNDIYSKILNQTNAS